MVNGGPLAFFRASRGLRQDYLLYPLLFIIVVEALNRILKKSRKEILIRDIVVVSGGYHLEVSHLFFADNILIFC